MSYEWRWRESNPQPPACKAGALPLSYIPMYYKPRVGIEPTSPCLQDRCSAELSFRGMNGDDRSPRASRLTLESDRVDSNHRPQASQTCAPPLSYDPMKSPREASNLHLPVKSRVLCRLSYRGMK